MSAAPDQENTSPLARIRGGDDSAAGQLLAVAYGELRELAGALFRDQPTDHTLQPTALVNEACIRLLRSAGNGWNDRKHFMSVAARAMRQLLTDHARARRTERR